VCFRVCYLSTPTDTHRTQKDTIVGVFLCSACFLHPLLHAEHEKTPLLVYFRARRVFYTQQHTPNMRRHHCWCLFMLGVFSTSTTAHRAREDTTVGVLSCSTCFLHPATRRAQGDTIIGVLSCSACFLYSPMHTEHEETPALVSFRALCLSYVPKGLASKYYIITD